GKSKALIIGRQIYEMNPYSAVAYHDKVGAENISTIFEQPWPLHIVVDEIDDIEMKTHIRVEAKKRKVPVIMATELADTVMLDVERYDLEPDRPIFHGIVPGAEQLIDKKIENYREWTKHAVGIIDPINMPLKMQKSVLKIGTTIVTHPQLGSTVMMTGGVVAFAAKNIALGNPIKSGRYVMSLEKILLADHQTRHYKRHHKRHTKIIRSSVKSM
ncbi:MAG TPA: ThiF family adenylyltransferase, partial [Candidatus Limnocylindrales bacterium]|nr:ThiF family adenylyltransferase [Candidatus Limnocylindrales bacterium]